MREFGKIITRKTDLTDAQVQEKYKFPAIIILHDNEDKILKITHYQKNGTKTIYDFSLSASKDFVKQSIADAIAGLQDNTLEFPTFADFPQPGEVGNVYIDLAEDKIYIWDSASSNYQSQSWNQTIITSIQTQITALQNSKLDKGTYTGTAQDLKNSIDSKLNKPTTTSNTTSYPFVVGENGNGNSARLPAGDLGKNFFNSDLSNTTARNHTMNAGVTVNTLGNPYSITGLPNKASDTTDFNNVLKYNPVTGQFAYGQAFVYNVPSTITVNHVNAPASPNVPSYVSALQNRITELNSSSMQKFNNWIIETEGGITNANIKVQNNDTAYITLNPYYNSGLPFGKILTNIKTGLVLPTNADWVISFNVNMGNNTYGGNQQGVFNRLVGIYSDSGELISPTFYFRDSSIGWNNPGVLTIDGATSSIVASSSAELANCMIFKVGNVLYFNAQVNGVKNTSSTFDIRNLILNSPNVGFVVANAYIDIPNGNQRTAMVSNIKYYIFP